MIMLARIVGTLRVGFLGGMIGAVIGIAGSPFGALASATVYIVGDNVWGFSANPNLSTPFHKQPSRKGAQSDMEGAGRRKAALGQ